TQLVITKYCKITYQR
ncbi:hypothetical protein D043_2345B, partial [Vibrio parahaemolyticus EKP-021]